MHRKGEAEDSEGADLGGGPAGDARAGRATAADDRHSAQSVVAKLREHARPGGVELPCGSRATPASDAVRLLDEYDADPGRQRCVLGRNEVGRRHAAACAVTEDEHRRGVVDQIEVRPRGADRSL
jgi:hypothetical protein